MIQAFLREVQNCSCEVGRCRVSFGLDDRCKMTSSEVILVQSRHCLTNN